MPSATWDAITDPVAHVDNVSVSGQGQPLIDRTEYLRAISEAPQSLTGGSAAAIGDLLVQELSGNDRVTRTTVQGQVGPIWIALAAMTVSGAAQYVRLAGHCPTINVTGAVGVGNLLRASATAGLAEVTSNPAEAFGVAFTGAVGPGTGAVEGFIFPRPGNLTGSWRYSPTAIASAGTITPDALYTAYDVTGTTAINTINGGWKGRVIALVFAVASCTVTSSGNIKLPATYTSTAGSMLTLVYDGTNWHPFAPMTAGGAAGGDLSGTYPNPSVAANAITTSKINTGGQVTKLQLNYAAATDLNSGTTMVASTNVNVGTAQSFSVDDASSTVAIFVGGFAMAVPTSTDAEVGASVLIDGTTAVNFAGGLAIAAKGGNCFDGAAPIVLTGLSVGSHTVQVRVVATQGGLLYCRATNGFESLYIRVFEYKR